MPQISRQEFEERPPRVHEFLSGVPLHDAWLVDLPRTRSGITLDEYLRTAKARRLTVCGCATRHPSLPWPSLWLGPPAGRFRAGNLCDASDSD